MKTKLPELSESEGVHRGPIENKQIVIDSVLILSGGLDSTVLLYKCLEEGYTPALLSFNYGQRHHRELGYAKTTANTLGLPWRQVVLPSELFRGSSQTSSSIPVPEGHYAEESMKATVVPNRNMVMLSLAAAYAISLKVQPVFYAAHSGDHAIYPDCRPEFVEAMDKCFFNCDWAPPKLYAPFLSWSKRDIVVEGARLNVDFTHTWSCYKGNDVIHHCGKCGTCVERIEAFVLARISDPTEYEK